MSETMDVSVVRGSSIAAELSEAQSAILAGVVTRRTLRNEEILIEEDQVDHCLYVIVSGRWRCAGAPAATGFRCMY